MLQRRGSRLARLGRAPVVQVRALPPLCCRDYEHWPWLVPGWCRVSLGPGLHSGAQRGAGRRQLAGDMGSSHSLGCGKHHIYDKIADPGHQQQQQHQAMGARKESIETLDVKISDLDNSSGWGGGGEWGGGQQFRRREDILYNIFMIETEDTGGRDLGWSWGRAASGEPHYGRLASLDVSLLEPGKREDNYF